MIPNKFWSFSVGSYWKNIFQLVSIGLKRSVLQNEISFKSLISKRNVPVANIHPETRFLDFWCFKSNFATSWPESAIIDIITSIKIVNQLLQRMSKHSLKFSKVHRSFLPFIIETLLHNLQKWFFLLNKVTTWSWTPRPHINVQINFTFDTTTRHNDVMSDNKTGDNKTRRY